MNNVEAAEYLKIMASKFEKTMAAEMKEATALSIKALENEKNKTMTVNEYQKLAAGTKDKKELVKALRCSASVKPAKCDGCPYRLLDEYHVELPVPYDVEIEGKKYYESCDVDRIAMDAADMLEELTN